jgi:hypothetical protein
MQERIWTIQEKLKVGMKAIEARNQGNMAEFEKITRSIPMTPYLAKFAKDYIGADFLLKSGWNLSEAESTYGSDWLTK